MENPCFARYPITFFMGVHTSRPITFISVIVPLSVLYLERILLRYNCCLHVQPVTAVSVPEASAVRACPPADLCFAGFFFLAGFAACFTDFAVCFTGLACRGGVLSTEIFIPRSFKQLFTANSSSRRCGFIGRIKCLHSRYTYAYTSCGIPFTSAISFI